MVKTLKNRRNKKAGTKRATRGGLFGMSSTVQKMRSFDKADFKKVLDYLSIETTAPNYVGFLLHANSRNEYDFAHFKKMYIYFRDLKEEAYFDEDYDMSDDVEIILSHFKFIVNSVHSKKTGAPKPASLVPVVNRNAQQRKNFLGSEAKGREMRSFLSPHQMTGR